MVGVWQWCDITVALLRRHSKNKWLTRHVTPQISGAFGPAVGALLPRPILWGAFDPEVCERVSPALQHRIVGEFLKLEQLNEDSNPVEKVTAIASKAWSLLPCLCSQDAFCAHIAQMSSSLLSFLPSLTQLVSKSASMNWLLHQKMKDLAQMQKLWFVLHQGTVTGVDKQQWDNWGRFASSCN